MDFVLTLSRIFNERENTSCENLPETHQYLRNLRAHIDAISKSQLLSEGGTMAEDAAALLSANRRRMHMNFHYSAHAAHVHVFADGKDRFPIFISWNRLRSIPSSVSGDVSAQP